MRVISNTSPITNLAAVGHLDLLQKLYGQIAIASDVRDELVLGGSGNNPGADVVVTAPWFLVEHVDSFARDQLVRQFPMLDLGETATLALAVAQQPNSCCWMTKRHVARLPRSVYPTSVWWVFYFLQKHVG